MSLKHCKALRQAENSNKQPFQLVGRYISKMIYKPNKLGKTATVFGLGSDFIIICLSMQDYKSLRVAAIHGVSIKTPAFVFFYIF